MKLALKIYLFAIILFLLVFNVAGYVNFEHSKNTGLQREVERSRNEEAAIVYGLWEQMPMVIIQDVLDMTAINRLSIESYHESFVEMVRGAYVEILDEDGNAVASNFDMGLPEARPELDFSSEDERRTIIRDHGERSLIFVASQIQINGQWFRVTYARDISDFYANLQDQKNRFFQSELLALAVFSLFMLLISQSIAKPVKEMVGMTRGIAAGKLERRLPQQKGYEFQLLGHNLNQMAEAIQSNTSRLEEANREKEQFIESFTHEMRTPLTSIIGYAEYVRNAKADEATRRQAVEVILEEGRHLERLAIKMMDLILLRKGTFDFAETDMALLVKEVMHAMKPKFSQKGIQVELDLEEGQWMVERDYFHVLLVNVLENAVKAIDKQGKISVSLWVSREQMRLQVSDNGIGMKKEEIKRVTEPFYMIDKARTRAEHGAGLGLSICQRILELHHGRFEITSRLKEGTQVAMVFERREERP